MDDAKKIVLRTPKDFEGRVFRILTEKAPGRENLGPLVAEITTNQVIFFRSLNRSDKSLKVGYMLLGQNLHRHESSYGLIPPPPNSRKKKGTWAWANYEPGCYDTRLTLADLVLCQAESITYVLSSDVVDWEKSRKAYKSPKKEKPKLPQPVGKAPPPVTETEDGWVMI